MCLMSKSGLRKIPPFGLMTGPILERDVALNPDQMEIWEKVRTERCSLGPILSSHMAQVA